MLIAAWIVGEGIVIYRVVARQHRPPMPGELLASSGLFVMLGLLSMAQPKLANLLAWGFDAAAFLNLAPTVLAGGATPTSATGHPVETGRTAGH